MRQPGPRAELSWAESAWDGAGRRPRGELSPEMCKDKDGRAGRSQDAGLSQDGQVKARNPERWPAAGVHTGQTRAQGQDSVTGGVSIARGS